MAGRVSARRPTHFLLLRQEKVSKEKATLPSASPVRWAHRGNLRCLGSNGVWLKLALRAQIVASPDPLLPVLLGATRRGWGQSRAIASLGAGGIVGFRDFSFGARTDIAMLSFSDKTGPKAVTDEWQL